VSLQIALAPNNQATPITRRTHNDLPTHVKGTVEWNRPNCRYYIPQHLTSNNTLEPVVFINNRWYELRYDASACTFYTQENLAIPVQNVFGIGFWNVTDPQHPEYQPVSRALSRTSFRYTPGSFDTSDSSEGSDTVSAHSAVSFQSTHEPSSPPLENPVVSIQTITSLFGPINVDAPTETPDRYVSQHNHCSSSHTFVQRTERDNPRSIHRRLQSIRVILERILPLLIVKPKQPIHQHSFLLRTYGPLVHQRPFGRGLGQCSGRRARATYQLDKTRQHQREQQNPVERVRGLVQSCLDRHYEGPECLQCNGSLTTCPTWTT
jgi:hypothetical protein